MQFVKPLQILSFSPFVKAVESDGGLLDFKDCKDRGYTFVA